MSLFGLNRDETSTRLAIILILTELRRLIKLKKFRTAKVHLYEIEDSLYDLKYSVHKRDEHRVILKLSQKLAANSIYFIVQILLKQYEINK